MIHSSSESMVEISRNDQMEVVRGNQDSAFPWNAGAWFGGCHCGCTAWLLTACGVSLFSGDLISGLVCLAGFVVLNAIGLSLWRNKNRLTAFAGAQIFLCAAAVVFIPIVLTLHWRGLASTTESFQVLLLPPALLLLFYFVIYRGKRGAVDTRS